MAHDDATSKSSISDVDNIRKILFGDQIAQIEEQIKRLDSSISQLQAENRNLRQALEMEVSAREKADKTLQEALATTGLNQSEIWNKNLGYQSELMKSLQKALDQFKLEIISGSKPEK